MHCLQGILLKLNLLIFFVVTYSLLCTQNVIIQLKQKLILLLFQVMHHNVFQ